MSSNSSSAGNIAYKKRATYDKYCEYWGLFFSVILIFNLYFSYLLSLL